MSGVLVLVEFEGGVVGGLFDLSHATARRMSERGKLSLTMGCIQANLITVKTVTPWLS